MGQGSANQNPNSKNLKHKRKPDRELGRQRGRGKGPSIRGLGPGTNAMTIISPVSSFNSTIPSTGFLPKANLDSKNWEEIAVGAWISAGWKQAALEYHHARGNRTLIVETPPEDLARLRRLMRDNVSLASAWAELNDPRNRPTPKATIDAVIHAVRERGLAALKEPVTAERLERCDAAAKAEIEQGIARLRKD